MTASKPRPYLAFGEKSAKTFHSAIQAAEAARKVFPSLDDFEAINASRFRCTQSVVDINGLVLLANTCSAALSRVRNLRYAHVHFQLTGEGRFHSDGRTFVGKIGANAVFLPEGCSYDHEFTTQSSVVARIEQARLVDTAKVMLGGFQHDRLLAVFNDPTAINLTFNELSFDGIFRNLFSHVDFYANSPQLLEVSGLDDVLYRAVVTAVIPEAFDRQTAPCANHGRRGRLDSICDYILSRLGEHITLSHLEQTANVSKGTLNTLFMKAFGMIPMKWVLEQRLLAARAMLNKRGRVSSIGRVLEECGFTDASSFASHYKRRFGESPSTTLARSRSRVAQ